MFYLVERKKMLKGKKKKKKVINKKNKDVPFPYNLSKKCNRDEINKFLGGKN